MPSTVLFPWHEPGPLMDPLQIRKTNTPDSHPVGIGLAGWVLWLRESDAQQSMLGTSLHSANVTPNPSSRVTQMSPRLAALCLPIPILPRGREKWLSWEEERPQQDPQVETHRWSSCAHCHVELPCAHRHEELWTFDQKHGVSICPQVRDRCLRPFIGVGTARWQCAIVGFR